ncbi:MAG: hypothetical protein H7122_13380 [Chitinophagaceae bacterium]|nr:hypothetical protein [Chitinophagaceae bacterium]
MQKHFNNTIKIKQFAILFTAAIFINSCKHGEDQQQETIQMARELATIDFLLRNAVFTESIAKAADSSYYAGAGQAAPLFLTPADDTTIIVKTARSEKIAIKLAGFYALECGIGLLSAQTNTTPVDWLKKITEGSVDSNAVLLLNRFANATWKAGQPFRDISRITRASFMGASSLSKDEVDKDYFQIFHSARMLLSSMKSVSDSAMPVQMQTLRSLLQDTLYAEKLAVFLHSSNDSPGVSPREPFLTVADDTAVIRKTAKEMKIATSVAGFYALESALNYLVTIKNQVPSAILKSLLDSSMSKEDQLLFARFANATWKAGQPFRDLNRITRPTFTPFYFLNEADIEKDMVQIRAAAARVLTLLQ